MGERRPAPPPGCFGCSKRSPGGLWLEFTVDGDGTISASFSPRPDHEGLPDLLHGGLAATALDETMASVGFLCDGVPLVTATLELRFLRPIHLDGRPLRVEAARRKPEPSSRQHISGRLLSADGAVAVTARGLFVQRRDPVPGGDGQRTARTLPPSEPSS